MDVKSCKMVWKDLLYLPLANIIVNPSRTPETVVEITLYNEQYVEYFYDPDMPELLWYRDLY